MKKALILIPLLIFTHTSYSAVYEASTLHNAVSRSETVQGLFQSRWDMLMEKNFYFDISCTLNWVFGFNVNTWNAGSEEYEPTDLNLVRTYGSMTFALPIGKSEDPDTPSSFMVAFTTTGFHYGLTKTISIDRENGDPETVTDYKHSQFFDDIYALSFLWRPYLYLHAGVITNKEYQPEDDGQMDYSDPLSSSTRAFISSNVLSVFGLQLNASEDKIESLNTDIAVTNLVGILNPAVKANIYIPAVTLGYSYRDEYNDEEYDAVWVKTGDTETSSSGRDTARLNIFSILVSQHITKSFYVDLFGSMQYINEDIFTKDRGSKIDVPVMKEFYCMLNLKMTDADKSYKKIYTGISWYWDPAVYVHRDNGTGYDVWGFILGCDIDFVLFGFEAKVVYDYSSELKKLVETTNKFSVEGSAFFRI